MTRPSTSLRRRGGFTLVELSIVLVIVTLMVAGVMIAREMVANARMQDAIKSSRQFSTAVMMFREKFNALPGDMPNATQFWGVAAGGSGTGIDATCSQLGDTSPSTGTETCNGNGDGSVSGNGVVPVTNAYYYERFRFWQHLANDGELPDHFTGVRGPGAFNDHVPGWNSPSSRYPSAEWTTFGARTGGCYSGSASVWNGCLGNMFELRNENDASYPVMPAVDAYTIDAKIDDGLPATGKVVTYKAAANPGCTTTNVEATALYNVTNAAIACSLIFTNAY
jgi:prepilin-type N-terminal cleavage/methylation domain-containing protein